MKTIIISMLLSVYVIHLHAQDELPYKGLPEFQNDTTAFINYNFIDRADQYTGKTFEFILRDLQIPVKCIIPCWFMGGAGLRLRFYSSGDVDSLCKNATNKPYSINIKWKEGLENKEIMRLDSYEKILNYLKDFQISEISVGYPPKSEHVRNKFKSKKAVQNELPYKSLFDFQNDTTAFINYNFIDRAEQYEGKTVEFIVHDLHIPVKYLNICYTDSYDNINGLYLYFYGRTEVDRLRESTLNKPYSIDIRWQEIAPENEDLMRRTQDSNKIINYYKDFATAEINVICPFKSEYSQNKRKLRSMEEGHEPIRFENGQWIILW